MATRSNGSATGIASAMSGVLFTGYMEKENPSLRGGYGKRFLVLTSESFYWFRRPEHYDLFGEERGSIGLGSIVSIEASPDDNTTFEIKDTKLGTRRFRSLKDGGTAGNCGEWITAIRSAMKTFNASKVNQSKTAKMKKRSTLTMGSFNEFGYGNHSKDPKAEEVNVTLITLKANSVELVIARNPTIKRMIVIPTMSQGDEILLSTSNGGMSKISMQTLADKAELSVSKREEYYRLHPHGEEPHLGLGGLGLSLGLPGEADAEDVLNQSERQDNQNQNLVQVQSQTREGGQEAPAREENDSTATSAGSGSGANSQPAAESKSADESPSQVERRRSRSDSNADETQAADLVETDPRVYYFDLPLSDVTLPSSLRVSVEASDCTTVRKGLVNTILFALLNDGHSSISLILAIMTFVVGCFSLISVDTNTSLLFVFCCLLCSCIIGQVVWTAVLADRASGGSASTSEDGPSPKNFVLTIHAHSYTSPDAPIEDEKSKIPERFINGCGGDMMEARKRWDITRHWRETNLVNSILCEPQPHFFEIKDLYPHYNCGRGREGNVIYWERPAELNVKQLDGRNINTDVMLRHWVFVTEYQFEVCCNRDQVAKCITVIDVKNIGIFDLMGKSLDFVKKSVGWANSHYPERSKAIYILNANSVFTTIYAMVKPWVHENTQKKVHICSPSENLEALLENIDIENIPTYYGGNMTFEGKGGKDVCRFHNPDVKTMDEFVHSVNKGEINSMESVTNFIDNMYSEGEGGGASSSDNNNSSSSSSAAINENTGVDNNPSEDGVTISGNSSPTTAGNSGKFSDLDTDEDINIVASNLNLTQEAAAAEGGGDGARNSESNNNNNYGNSATSSAKLLGNSPATQTFIHNNKIPFGQAGNGSNGYLAGASGRNGNGGNRTPTRAEGATGGASSSEALVTPASESDQGGESGLGDISPLSMSSANGGNSVGYNGSYSTKTGKGHSNLLYGGRGSSAGFQDSPSSSTR